MPTVWCRYIELTLQRVGSDATALQADLKKRLDAALERVKPLSGVEVKIGALALLRQTPESNPRMAQRYSDSGLSAPPEVWKGTQQVFCVDHDMDGLQAALTELQKQGAVLTEMHFDLTPETWTRIRKELAGEAVSALRTEAAQVAESMGLQVHRYLNVQLNEEYDQRQIQARRIRFRTTAGRWSSPTATSTSRWQQASASSWRRSETRSVFRGCQRNRGRHIRRGFFTPRAVELARKEGLVSL